MRRGHGIKNACLIVICAGILAACGKADEKATTTMEYYEKYQKDLVAESKKAFAEKDYHWILHIHFEGNDFGAHRGEEQVVDFLPDPRKEKLKKGEPFFEDQLLPSQAALESDFYYRSPQVLGSFVYRHKSGKRAIESFKRLFHCGKRSSPVLPKIMLIASGSSHGGHEVDFFARQLVKECGKKIDALVLGDAVNQPLLFPKREVQFLEKYAQVPCLSFFQRNPLEVLRGGSVKQCKNVEIAGKGYDIHQYVTVSAYFFIVRLLHDLDYEFEPLQ